MKYVCMLCACVCLCAPALFGMHVLNYVTLLWEGLGESSACTVPHVTQ